MAVITVLVLVYVIAKVEHVIHRVLAGWITKGIEEAKGKVTAGIDCQSDLGDKIVGRRRGLCTANRTRDVGITHAELVVIPRVWA